MNRRLHDIAPIVSMVVLILALTWAGVVTLANNLREAEIERSYNDSQKYALQFAEQVARTIENVQSVIEFSAYQISRTGSADELKKIADAGVLAMKPIVQVTFVDTQGYTVATNAGPDHLRTDLRDRAHIRAHLDSKADDLYIGAPVLGRVSGKWSIQFTQKVHDQDGVFIGIIVASVDPYYFQRFWSETLGSDRIITLLRTDGVILTRSAALDWILVTGVRRPDITMIIGDRDSGRFTAESSEGGTRIGYFARVPSFPLIVLADGVAAEVTAIYQALQTRSYLIALAMTAIVLILGGWLVSIAGRLRREEQLAKKAEEAKSAFLAAMSHELRTPLNALLGFVGLLNKTSLNKEQLSYVKTIQHSGHTLRYVVSDVLDFSKLEAGALRVESSPCNIHECLLELEKVTIVLVGDKPIEIKVSRTSDVPELAIIDGARLYQVLLNICGNAAKFTHSGHINVSASLLRRDDLVYLVVDVSDTGPGIEDSVMSKLFRPFEQGAVLGSLRAAGTGLGLAISKMLLNLMGGNITVKSVLGVGSTFVLEVPIQVLEDSPVRQEARTTREVSKPLRILIADDARSSRTFLRILLQQKGHEVVEVEDGVQAMETLLKRDFDIVFLDIQMPRLDGLAVAMKVSQWFASRRRPRIVAVSAMARPEDIEAARQAGIVTYITKPIHEEQIDNALRIADKSLLVG
jgi:signal transduction histidine kinase/ActR/RegA family two-component response regulator